MNTKKHLLEWVLGASFLMALSACTPVNSSTRIKNTPDAYSRNYCCGEVAVPRSIEKSSPWIVYSDRDQNPTFYNPGGKVKLKEVGYFDPLAVIKEKGDYVEVVKYDPGVFEGKKVKDPQKAEYLGWMPKSNLILSSKAMTDVATGFVIKMITMFKDTFPLTRTEEFFTEGAVTLYSEPELLNPIGTVSFQKPVYLAKRNVSKDKALIIGKEDITPESAPNITSGWISSSMLLPLGEMLYADFSELPIQSFNFTNMGDGSTVSVPKSSVPNYVRPYKLPDFIGVNPVYKINELGDNVVSIKTTTPVSIINNDNNLVYSLAGSPITKRTYDDLLKNLKHINIMIVFSSQKEVNAKFKQYVSFLQQLKDVVKSKNKDFHFRVGYYVGFDAENSKQSKCKLKDNIENVLSSLEKYADSNSRKVKYDRDAWSALRGAMKLIAPYKDEQNIILLIGENGNQKEQIDDVLVNGLVKMNCRIVGCQLFSNTGNSFNNFVLQVEDMISRSANKLSNEKKKILVNSHQLRAENRYKEYSENVYGLDYPKNSMQQGWVIFPNKKENLSPDLLISVTDSTINMIEYESKDILSHIQESFKGTGVGRTSINSLWLTLTGSPATYNVPSALFQPLSSMNPVTNVPTYIKTEVTELKKAKYMMFVSENELNRIRQFINELLAVRVDYKLPTASMKKSKDRTCPDMLRLQNNSTMDNTHEYQNTSKVRKSMMKTYIRWAQDEKVYPKKKSQLKKMSLSHNQQEIFSMISFEPLLYSTKLEALKQKGKLSDAQLDKLQDYLLSKLKCLEEAINAENKYEFNGQIYYMIDAVNLP